MRSTVTLVLVLVLSVGIMLSFRFSVDNDRPSDFTDLKLEDTWVRAIEPTRDPNTGFIVGGRNATTLIEGLTDINGISIDKLEVSMRPGAASQAGFLGKDESLLAVLAADNQYVLDCMGTTHQELAKHLKTMLAIYGTQQQSVFLYHGRSFKIEVFLSTGIQESPFNDGTDTGGDIVVHNMSTGGKLEYSGLIPDMVERYGFYEGKGTRYRVDPRQIAEVFDFLKVKPRRRPE